MRPRQGFGDLSGIQAHSEHPYDITMKPIRFSPGRAALLAGVIGISLSASANAAILIGGAVGNGDFSNSANNGSTPDPGLGLLRGHFDQALGTGPWRTEVNPLALVIGAPDATIGSGAASFTGIATANVLGLVNNSGSFYQDSGSAWQANTKYTLTVTVTGSSLLTADIFSATGGAGVSLYSSTNPAALGGDIIDSFTNGPLSDIEVTLLNGGTSALVELTYTTGSEAPNGNVGVRLFVGETTNPLEANVLTGITFDNVTLDATPVPEASSAVLGLSALGSLALVRRRKR